MEVIYNGQSLPNDKINLSPTNRAFCYGDGIFETMLVRRGSCPLLSYHYKRLIKGAQVLQMKLSFSEQELEEYIWKLSLNYHDSLLRIRLQLWRKAGGLYAPEERETEFLLTAAPFSLPGWEKKKVAFAKTIHLQYSAWSALKTMNALPYVLAGLEKKERQLGDIILTDEQGNVAECSSSNLFWLKDNCWYTPDLKTGCIAGVMRAYLLDKMHQKKITIKEVLLPKEQLTRAQCLIACNATGLYNIPQVENHYFENKNGREQLADLIQLPVL